jgi:cobalt-zinc-cadmium efflux system outer membrane protein
MRKARALVLARIAVAAALLLGLPSTGAVLGAVEPLNLEALLAEAESNHPELKALAARQEAAAQVPSQMDTLPDPLVTVAYTNESLDSYTLGTSIGSSLAFTWTQDVPYPGKRQLAADVARGQSTTAERQTDLGRVRIRSQVKRLYFELHRIDRVAEVLDETRKVLASLVDSARARYESGEGTLENVLKAQTELTAIEVDIATNRQERRVSEAMLAASLGRSSDASFGPAIDLPPVSAPDRPALEAQAVADAPEIRLLEATADTETRRLDLARKDQKPDLMYGVGYSNRGGLDPMIMGMFGVRLPLYRGRKQAQAVAQTEYELEAAQREVDRGRIEIVARVRDLFAQFDRASDLVPLYADGLIPQARSTLDAATGSYAAGKIEFITLLDDALKMFRYEIEYERQRVDALQALTGLEEITGIELIQAAPGGAHD